MLGRVHSNGAQQPRRSWTQANIVAAVKGSDVVKSGSDAEMWNFLNSMGQNLDGQRWKAACEWCRGSPTPENILEEMSAGRPMIVTYKTGPTGGNAVVLFGTEFAEKNGRKSLKNVFIFEPTAAERLVLDSTGIHQNVTTWFAVKVGFVGETTYDLVKNSTRPSLYIPILGDILRGGMIRVQVGEKPRPLEAHEYQQPVSAFAVGTVFSDACLGQSQYLQDATVGLMGAVLLEPSNTQKTLTRQLRLRVLPSEHVDWRMAIAGG